MYLQIGSLLRGCREDRRELVNHSSPKGNTISGICTVLSRCTSFLHIHNYYHMQQYTVSSRHSTLYYDAYRGRAAIRRHNVEHVRISAIRNV